jgi:hypothetical protein
MQTEFERSRVDVAGKGVTITSWYEPDKQRWRANAPAYGHMLTDVAEHTIIGGTRAQAIRAACEYLTKRLIRPTVSR